MYIIVPLIIIVFIVGASFGIGNFRNIDFSPKHVFDLPTLSETKQRSQSSGNAGTGSSSRSRPSTSSQNQPVIQAPPPITLDTTITNKQPGQQVFTKTNSLVFEFTAAATPETKERISFQTKIEGLEEEWQTTTRTSRTITFPAGEHTYTFLVRAKLGDTVDTTPDSVSFTMRISPHLETVSISSFRPTKSGTPFFLQLTNRLQSGTTTNITNWAITARANGGSFRVGNGIQNVPPNASVATDPVTIRRQDTVRISGAQSPFGAQINFRPNSCFGYLKPYYTFPLSVSTSCAERRPPVETISHLTPACQDFILKRINYSSCTVPDMNNPDFGIVQDSACRTHVADRFSYEACRANYSSNSDYLKNEWHVYKNRSFGHALHDTITLYDANGLFIDEHIY